MNLNHNLNDHFINYLLKFINLYNLNLITKCHLMILDIIYFYLTNYCFTELIECLFIAKQIYSTVS